MWLRHREFESLYAQMTQLEKMILYMYRMAIEANPLRKEEFKEIVLRNRRSDEFKNAL